MSHAQYEGSIASLEAARAVALISLEHDYENKSAIEEVAAYSKLIGDAKAALAALPVHTGVLCVRVLDKDWNASYRWYNFVTSEWSDIEPPHGLSAYNRQTQFARGVLTSKRDEEFPEFNGIRRPEYVMRGNGELCIMGGAVSNHIGWPIDNFDIYASRAGMWTHVTKWESHTMTGAAANNLLYLMNNKDNECSVYDFATDEWRAIPTPPEITRIIRGARDTVLTIGCVAGSYGLLDDSRWTPLPLCMPDPAAKVSFVNLYD